MSASSALPPPRAEVARDTPGPGAPSPFDRVRARTVVVALLAIPFAVEVLRRTLFAGVAEGRWDLAASLAFHGGGLLFLAGYAARKGVSLPRLVGGAPRGWRAWALVGLALPLLALSLGTAALQFSLLATVAPEWVAGLNDAVEQAAGSGTGRGYVLGQALVGVLAAALEELLFRGVLLARWERKWGARRAVLATSLAFGVLHLDLLGSFVFGLAMALLYLHTRSLLVPFACHAANNLVIALSDLADGGGAGDALSPAGPSADWGAAALGIGVALPVLLWFFRAFWPRGPWRIPYGG